MSAGEILWRVRGKLRDAVDRRSKWFRSGQLPAGLVKQIGACGQPDSEAWPTSLLSQPLISGTGYHPRWADELIAYADALCDHQIRLFGDNEIDLGKRIDWNREYRADVQAPITFAPDIDYRDYRVTGDCKWIWELNRHHHLVVLGRAYRVTGDRRYADEAARQILDWIEQCPFGRGMNWRSGLELAIRLINWVWALALIRPAGAIDEPAWQRINTSVWLHLWEVSRKFSRYSSANNHLIGEAAGVYIGASCFAGLPRAAEWRREAKEILVREIAAQTHADGGNREQAFGYHQFVLQFLLLAGLCGRGCGDDFPEAYWDSMEKMFEFSARMLEGGQHLPQYGDSDDGYVLDLGERGDARAWLAAGSAIFGRPDWLKIAKTWRSSTGRQAGFETEFWLASNTELSRPGPPQRGRDFNGDIAALKSHAFPGTGLFLLQAGTPEEDDAVSVTFDCGELGFKSIAAHGHADALSITLRVGGVDVLVDPGTYDYFTFPAWRRYFRSTAAHNTLMLDGLDQSEMSGTFMWGRRATARCEQWTPTEQGGIAVGVHDGYARLADPAVHRRTVELKGREGRILIQDDVECRGGHQATLMFHFSEACEVSDLGGGKYRAVFNSGEIELSLDSQLTGSLYRGETSPIFGWLSRGYHSRLPTFTLAGRSSVTGSVSLKTRIEVRLSRNRGDATVGRTGDIGVTHAGMKSGATA